jgi:hypothetical protein
MFRARIALVSMALVAACGGEVGNQGEPNPRSGPPCPTSIDEVASQVFELSCVDAGCHGSNDRAAGLDLQASSLELELFGKEAALCDAEVRVVPGDAASSYLMDMLRFRTKPSTASPHGSTGSTPQVRVRLAAPACSASTSQPTQPIAEAAETSAPRPRLAPMAVAPARAASRFAMRVASTS